MSTVIIVDRRRDPEAKGIPSIVQQIAASMSEKPVVMTLQDLSAPLEGAAVTTAVEDVKVEDLGSGASISDLTTLEQAVCRLLLYSRSEQISPNKGWSPRDFTDGELLAVYDKNKTSIRFAIQGSPRNGKARQLLGHSPVRAALAAAHAYGVNTGALRRFREQLFAGGTRQLNEWHPVRALVDEINDMHIDRGSLQQRRKMYLLTSHAISLYADGREWPDNGVTAWDVYPVKL